MILETMPKLFRSLVVVSTLSILAGCATPTTSVREHQDFSRVANDIESVVIAPPQVNIELVVFTGENERLTDKERGIKKGLSDIAASRLTAEGLRVVEFDFEKVMAEDDEFAYAVTQSLEALEQAEKDLYNGQSVTVENKNQFQASLGPVVNTIAERTGAEAVLLMEYYGFEKSSGMQAKDFAASVLMAALLGSTTVLPSSGAALEVALVSTESGDVLWTNRKSAQVVDAMLARHALNELPDVNWEAELNQAIVARDDEVSPTSEPEAGVSSVQ